MKIEISRSVERSLEENASPDSYSVVFDKLSFKKIKYFNIIWLKKQEKFFFVKVQSIENQKKRFSLSNEKYC